MIELFLNKQWYLFYLLAIMFVSGFVKDKGYLNKVFLDLFYVLDTF